MRDEPVDRRSGKIGENFGGRADSQGRVTAGQSKNASLRVAKSFETSYYYYENKVKFPAVSDRSLRRERRNTPLTYAFSLTCCPSF